MHLNKIGLLALSMSAVFMASSCSKGDPKVTEEEFNTALSLVDVNYLQTKITMSMETTVQRETMMKMNFTDKQQISPKICYFLGTGKTTDPEGTKEMYAESYATKTDANTVHYMMRESKTGKINEGNYNWDEKDRQYCFLVPQEIGSIIIGQLQGLTFDKFDYKNGVYVFESSEDKNSVKYSISFSNKKLVKFVYNMNFSETTTGTESKMNQTYNLSYKELIPSNPMK